jgi:hypothetical protein
MNPQHRMPLPVPGLAFPPFCKFGICLREEPHTDSCRTHQPQETQPEEIALPY